MADLPLRIDDWDLERLEADTSSGFTRVTTVVSLSGDGTVGRGEDVTYDVDEHDALLDAADFDLTGEHTLDSFSAALDDVDLFPAGDPDREAFFHYRRWGFESAALDLALRQADTDLAAALDREYDPVRFVVSTRLDADVAQGDDADGDGDGDPDGDGDEDAEPTAERVHEWLAIDPALEFKLDATEDWTPDLVADLAATDAVRIVDFKAHYEGTEVDGVPDPALYRLVLDSLPGAIVEDPALTAETDLVFEGRRDRISWDVPFVSAASLDALPFAPTWLNVKPSRFGTVESLFSALERCEREGIRLYGGGQFELDVGRKHLHALASIFYPDGPNDVAPRGYNEPEPQSGLPTSPLPPPNDPVGLDWDGS